MSECRSSYRRGCRCEGCRAANAARHRKLRADRRSRGATPNVHGSTGYSNYGCRCDVCVEAWRLRCNASDAAARKRAEERRISGEEPPEHGVRGFAYYGCRCEVCTSAHREDYRRRYAADEAFREKMRKRYRENYKDWQQESRQMAERYGEQWTGPELELAARGDLTTRQLAQMLGRTFAAVDAMRNRIRRGDPTANWLAGRRGKLH